MRAAIAPKPAITTPTIDEEREPALVSSARQGLLNCTSVLSFAFAPRASSSLWQVASGRTV